MNPMDEKRRRFQLHFRSRQIAWVPFWGISKLRRRGLILAGEIPGDMIEYDCWYERMLSPATFDQLAEMGFNLVVLPFSLGGCNTLEEQEHEDFRTAAKLCVERKIVPLPYLQYQNVLPESFPKKFSSWAIQPDGTHSGYAYYRPTLCQSSDEFKDYFSALIRKSQEYGAAGLWIDNSYLKPCICPDCRRKFEQWLRENKKEMLDQLHLIPEQIMIPTSLNTTFADPVFQAFHQFNQARNTAILQGFEQEMRKWNPNGLFASNPALYKGVNMAVKGLDFTELLRLHDLIYLENHHRTGMYEGEIDGNYRGFADSEALGVTAISGTWKKAIKINGIQLKSGMPDSEEIAPMMLEPLLFGGATGAFWMIREMPNEYCRTGEDKLRGYFEFPPMRQALADVMKIIQSVPAGMTNHAETGVLFSNNSWKLDFNVFEESYFAVTEALTEANIPWRTIYDDVPDSFTGLKLLIIPSARVFSDEKIAMLRATADSGIKILVVSASSGMMNEHLLRRNDSPLAEFAGSSFYAHDDFSSSGNWYLLRDNNLRSGLFLNNAGDSKLAKPDYLTSGKLIETVKKLTAPTFRIEGAGVIGTIRRTREGKDVLLLLDYQTPAQEKIVKVYFTEKHSGIVSQPSQENFPFDGHELVFEKFKLFAMVQI